MPQCDWSLRLIEIPNIRNLKSENIKTIISTALSKQKCLKMAVNISVYSFYGDKYVDDGKHEKSHPQVAFLANMPQDPAKYHRR